MPLTPTSGSVTTTGTTEVNLVNVTTGGPKYFTVNIFLHNLTATETIRFFIYLYDNDSSAFRLAFGGDDDPITFTGVQSTPGYYTATLLSRQFKIGMKMTAGTNRAITYDLFEQT